MRWFCVEVQDAALRRAALPALPDPAQELFAQGAVAAAYEDAALVGHFVEEDEARAAALALGAAAAEREPPEWAQAWARQHVERRISERLSIAPSFVPASEPRAQVRLLVNPGLAFGTGAHPTTQLCLRALEEVPLRGATVLDVGTGTGVLAIAALLLGARAALGTDLDPIALRTAGRVALRNQAPGLTLTDRAPSSCGPHALVLANLPPEAQESLAPEVSAALAPGGTLVLSGFLADQAGPIARLYPRLREERREARAGWALLVLRAAS